MLQTIPGQLVFGRNSTSSCENVVDCENCFDQKQGSHCMMYNLPIPGFLAIEDKHAKLVEKGAVGAYRSVKSAMKKLSKNL